MTNESFSRSPHLKPPGSHGRPARRVEVERAPDAVPVVLRDGTRVDVYAPLPRNIQE